MQIAASVTSSTAERKTKTTILLKRQRFYLKANALSEDIPLIVVFKALGVESDQEIMQLIGSSIEFREACAPSFEHCYEIGIYTAVQVVERGSSGHFRGLNTSPTAPKALTYIGEKIKLPRRYGSKRSKADDARELLLTVVLSHIPVKDWNFRSKSFYLGLMVRRILQAVNEVRKGWGGGTKQAARVTFCANTFCN